MLNRYQSSLLPRATEDVLDLYRFKTHITKNVFKVGSTFRQINAKFVDILTIVSVSHTQKFTQATFRCEHSRFSISSLKIQAVHRNCFLCSYLGFSARCCVNCQSLTDPWIYDPCGSLALMQVFSETTESHYCLMIYSTGNVLRSSYNERINCADLEQILANVAVVAVLLTIPSGFTDHWIASRIVKYIFQTFRKPFSRWNLYKCKY